MSCRSSVAAVSGAGMGRVAKAVGCRGVGCGVTVKAETVKGVSG